MARHWVEVQLVLNELTAVVAVAGRAHTELKLKLALAVALPNPAKTTPLVSAETQV